MMAGVAVFDLDGTVTRYDTLGPYLLGFLWRHPWRAPRLLATLPALFAYARRGDRGALKGEIIHALLGGASYEQIRAWTERFVPQLLRRGLFAEALAAMAERRARGEQLLLMSASTDLYVPRIAEALGFDLVHCTEVLWQADGRLDGRLAGPNCRDEEKRRVLAALIAQENPPHVVAYGNSDADLPHMRLAQEAYLVNGPALKADEAPHIRAVRWQGHARV